MPPLNLLIKPSSSACNMACSYCFYYDVAANRMCGFKGFMQEAMLEKLVKEALEYADVFCNFAFQGGEPTLVGLEFYQKLLEFQKKYNIKNLRIHNSIQTNGTLIDEKWATFFAKNGFLVGLSIDGTRQIHDKNRKDKKKQGTFERIMQTVKLFEKHRVAYNVLSVVTGEAAKQIVEIYQFFKKQGFSYLQFIPCLEPFSEEKGEGGYAMTVKDYESYLITLFDAWLEDLRNGRYVSIRHLDNWMGIMLGRAPEACSMQGRCSIQFVVEGDGDVYPCDFYVLDEWLLGNVKDMTLQQMISSKPAKQFVSESIPLPEDCKSCRYVQLCRNGCKRDRIAQQNQADKLFYCDAIKSFFTQREKQIEEAAGILLRMMRSR